MMKKNWPKPIKIIYRRLWINRILCFMHENPMIFVCIDEFSFTISGWKVATNQNDIQQKYSNNNSFWVAEQFMVRVIELRIVVNRKQNRFRKHFPNIYLNSWLCKKTETVFSHCNGLIWACDTLILFIYW